jgi:hypothetical protein
MAGNLYLFGASILGTIVLYAGFQANSNQTRVQARRVLLASVLYLPLLYGLMALDSELLYLLAVAWLLSPAAGNRFGVLPSRSPIRLAPSSKASRLQVTSGSRTSCSPTALTCPRMSSQMHEVQTALAGQDVKLVSMTVDPERDTPESLPSMLRSIARLPVSGIS